MWQSYLIKGGLHMKKHTVIKQEINDNRKKIQELQELIKGKEQNEKMLIKAYEDRVCGCE